FLLHLSRSTPTDLMFRTTWSLDSSKPIYRQRSLLRHAASTKEAASVVFPLPAVPVTSTLDPRKYPLPSIISSKSSTPEDTRSFDTACCKWSDVNGKIDM